VESNVTAIDSSVGGMLWWITIIAVAIGAFGTALGLSNRRRSRDLEERLDHIEEANRRARQREGQRARLRAFIEQRFEVRWYLTIENQGPGAAQDVTISIDGTSLERSPVVASQALNLAGLGSLGAQGTVRIPLQASPEKLQLDLSWSDATGDLSFYEAELTR
jgi:hypothetical protein